MTGNNHHQVLIEVPGLLLDGGLVIQFGSRQVALSQNQAIALLWMVAQRVNTENGLTHHSLFEDDKDRAHPTISRLRARLDQELGRGAAGRLFKHCGRSYYQLLVNRENIVVHEAVRELVPFFLPEKLVDKLLSPARGLLSTAQATFK